MHDCGTGFTLQRWRIFFFCDNGPCNCSWLKNGLTDGDPSAVRADTNENIAGSQCSQGYASHNKERILQASTVVEQRNLPPNLGLFFSQEEMLALRMSNDQGIEKSKVDLSSLPKNRFDMVLRLRMTWPSRETKADKYMHELYAVPGVVNPPVLHHLLALSRFLVWLLQCAALLEQKGPEFDVKLAGYYSMARDLKKSEYEYPNFLGPRGKNILAALSEGIMWDKEADLFSTRGDKPWILEGLFDQSLQQAFMACCYFVPREVEIESQYALTMEATFELAALSLETRVRFRAISHISTVWADYMHAGMHGWSHALAYDLQSRGANDEAKIEEHHRQVKRHLRCTVGGGAAGRAFKNSGHNGVQKLSGKHLESDEPEEGDTFTKTMRVKGDLRTLYQAMKKEGGVTMKLMKSGLEWQEQLSEKEAVQIFEDKKENLTDEDISRQERYLPPVISFDQIGAISPSSRSVPALISQHATTGQVRRSRPPDSDLAARPLGGLPVAKRGRKGPGRTAQNGTRLAL